MYQLVQWVYITFQIGVSSYGAIYGSFAALPLLLVWMQVSWLVVLFGAEISFAVQNVETYEFEHDCLGASHEFKRLLALRVTHLCVKNFQASEKAWTEDRIAEHLEIPIRLIREIVFELTDAGILSATRIDDDERTFGYQPARELGDLTVLDVFTLLDRRGLDALPVGNTPELETLSQRLELFRQTIRESSHNLPLKEI
jgi:membrane protein